MLYSVVITVFIASAVIGIFCFKAVRLDKCRRRVKSYVLIPCTCSARELELMVKACYWEEVFAGRECMRDIILLTEQGCDTTQAESLERQYSIVHRVSASELADFFGMTN